MNKSNRNHNPPVLRVNLPPDVQRGLDQLKRDIILENDRVYTGNIICLQEATQRGSVPVETSFNVRKWLVMSSLRRNHVPMSEARRIMLA